MLHSKSFPTLIWIANGKYWNPLLDDAQAMALVKKFDLAVWGNSYVSGEWKYHAEMGEDGATSVIGHGDTHNRAICECVAKIRLASREHV